MKFKLYSEIKKEGINYNAENNNLKNNKIIRP